MLTSGVRRRFRNSRISTARIMKPFGLQPRFSPNGRRLVYTQLSTGNFYQMWLSDVNGNSVAALTEGHPGLPQRVNGNGRWSPDGQYIYFQVEAPEHYLDESPFSVSPGVGTFSNIWAIHLATGTVSQLTDIPIKMELLDGIFVYASFQPFPHPTENRIYWAERFELGSASTGNLGRWRIKRADLSFNAGTVTASNETVVYTPPGTLDCSTSIMGYLSTNPDVLLVAGHMDGEHEYHMSLYAVNVETDTAVNLTGTNTHWEEGATVCPNKKIVFLSSRDSVNTFDTGDDTPFDEPVSMDWYVMNADGSGVERLTYWTDATAPEVIYPGRRMIATSIACSDDGWHLAGTLCMDQSLSNTPDGSTWLTHVYIIDLARPFA